MDYCRSNPCQRYELQGLYRAMHEEGETFLDGSPGLITLWPSDDCHLTSRVPKL